MFLTLPPPHTTNLRWWTGRRWLLLRAGRKHESCWACDVVLCRKWMCVGAGRGECLPRRACACLCKKRHDEGARARGSPEPDRRVWLCRAVGRRRTCSETSLCISGRGVRVRMRLAGSSALALARCSAFSLTPRSFGAEQLERNLG